MRANGLVMLQLLPSIGRMTWRFVVSEMSGPSPYPARSSLGAPKINTCQRIPHNE